MLRADIDSRTLAGAQSANYEVKSRSLAKPIGIGVAVLLKIFARLASG